MFASKLASARTKAAQSSAVGSARRHASSAAPRPATGAIADLLLLQRTIGNQATQRLLAGRAPPSPSGVRPKLAVGRADDPREHEADRIAGQVMRTGAPAVPLAGPPAIDARSAGGGEETLRREAAAPPKAAADSEASGAVDEVLRSPGQPLDAQTRSFFEPRFGRDFGHVRVHVDAKAALSAKSVGALAYTAGPNVVFGTAQYSPGSADGRRLLAHELAHLVQQGSSPEVQRKPDPRARAKHRPQSTDEPVISGPKPIGLLSMDYSGPGACGGRPCVTDDEIYAPAEKSRAEDAQNDRNVVKARVRSRFQRSNKVIEDKISEMNVRDYDRLSQTQLDNVDSALAKVTANNDPLLLAFYDYYANSDFLQGHRFRSVVEKDTQTGYTESGRSGINPHVLNRDSEFPTDDPTSLLGGTLIHEFVHTHQESDPLNYTQEAKAYGVEYFFSENMGDKKRSAIISKRYETDQAKKEFYTSYSTMVKLYDKINKGGPSAAEAQQMTVEFISNDPKKYGKELKSLVSDISKNYYVP